MGASESKLVFKQGIFRLSEEHAIPANDPYWTGFWELPESADDVFSLFSPADIRRTRDSSLQNLETLLLAVTSRLDFLCRHPSFPDLEVAPERDLLNCIRVLTRVLPYVYETDSLSEWEERFFWSTRRRKAKQSNDTGEILFDEQREQDNEETRPKDTEPFEDAKPLAEELLDNLIDLLFYNGFTVPRLPNAKSKVSYTIWQSGVGCKNSIATSKEFESNRSEVLRLLLTIASRSMYLSPAILPVQGVRAITYLATCPDKQIVLSVLCSLLNTVIKYNSASWRLPYDHVVWKDSRQSLVVYSLHTLLVLLLYTIPEDGRGPAPKNYYRHFLGRLHRPEDFQFLAEGMTRVLSQPMQATTLYLPGSQKSVQWAPEMLMLFWEVLQCNKRFRSFIIESSRAHDFLIVMLFYAIEHKTDVTRQGIVRMCVFVLQTMSVESAFGKNLNKRFEAQDTLPASIRISNFRGTYADFLIMSIHTLIIGSKGKLDAIYPALLAIISNIAAYVDGLSMQTCSKLLQLFSTMSSPSFLLGNESNHNLLHSLLESINTIVEHQYAKNPNLIYTILRHRRKIEALRTFTLEGGQQEIERAAQRRKEILSGGSTVGAASPVIDSRRTSTAESPHPLSRSNTGFSQASAEDDGTFTIGDDEDEDVSDNEGRPTPSQSSRAPSISSSSAVGAAVNAVTGGSVGEDGVPVQVRGMSEKARGKMPVSAQSFSRQSSISSITTPVLPHRSGFAPNPAWIDSWLSALPLHTLLTLTKVLGPKLPAHLPPTSSTNLASPQSLESSSPELVQFLASLPSSVTHPQISAMLSDPSPIHIHLFEWSTLSLGWYLSVLWSLVFSSEMHIAPTSSTTTSTITNTVTGGAAGAGSVGPIGVWNGTFIRLFQVSTEGKREGPSLSKPQGAVDAVGTRLVAGVQGLGLGGLMGRVVGSTTVATGQGNGNGNGTGSGRIAAVSGSSPAFVSSPQTPSVDDRNQAHTTREI